MMMVMMRMMMMMMMWTLCECVCVCVCHDNTVRPSFLQGDLLPICCAGVTNIQAVP